MANDKKTQYNLGLADETKRWYGKKMVLWVESKACHDAVLVFRAFSKQHLFSPGLLQWASIKRYMAHASHLLIHPLRCGHNVLFRCKSKTIFSLKLSIFLRIKKKKKQLWLTNTYMNWFLHHHQLYVRLPTFSLFCLNVYSSHPLIFVLLSSFSYLRFTVIQKQRILLTWHQKVNSC